MTGMLKLGVIGAAFAAVAAGCSSVEPTPSVVATESAMNRNYGVWVGKGPRILSADGKPLTEATVCLVGEETMTPLPIDAEGHLILNRYLAASPYGSWRDGFSSSVTVMCPGYHSRRNVALLAARGIVPEIRLEPITGQPAVRKFQATASLPPTEMERPLGFDLVKGDWLPPHGWGTTEDLRVTVSTNCAGEIRFFSFCVKDLKAPNLGGGSSGCSAAFSFVRPGDGLAASGSDAEGCTNASFTVGWIDLHRRLFRARGYLGAIDEVDVSKIRDTYYDRVRNGDDNSSSLRASSGPELVRLMLRGVINPEPGLKTFEPATAVGTLRPPAFHTVPEGDGMLAFGVSPDGRAAVLFGRTDKGARVPEIFEKGVYTSDPASDLPHLETLFVERRVPGERLAGFPELRTLVLRGYGHQRFEEKAFADNPRLDAVVLESRSSGFECAGNAFEGCSTNLTAVFNDRCESGGRPWETLSVTNLFAKMVKVYRPDPALKGVEVAPKLDFAKGTVDIPVVRLREDALELEYADGRLLRFCKDGKTERLFK